MASKDRYEAKQRLLAFRAQALAAELRELGACLTMLKNWEHYIHNAFDCPYSNGFPEDCNNTIKVLKRLAFGF